MSFKFFSTIFGSYKRARAGYSGVRFCMIPCACVQFDTWEPSGRGRASLSPSCSQPRGASAECGVQRRGSAFAKPPCLGTCQLHLVLCAFLGISQGLYFVVVILEGRAVFVCALARDSKLTHADAASVASGTPPSLAAQTRSQVVL